MRSSKKRYILHTLGALQTLWLISACTWTTPETVTDTCVPGASTECACADLSQGAQTCLQTGVYGACICVAPPVSDSGTQSCIPGQSEACTCENGLLGAQICNISGNGYDPCVCEPRFLVDGGIGCFPGSHISCQCENGSMGQQTCLETGEAYGQCMCPALTDGGSTPCIPGYSEACVCSDGEPGAQTCNEAGDGFEPCTCAPVIISEGCAPAHSILCYCEDGSEGAQQCNAYGTGYGACNCEQALTNCTPNASKSCSCTDGRDGAQTCMEDGSAYTACECVGSNNYDAGLAAMVCVPGESQSCACINGDTGAQLCADDGSRFYNCICEEPPAICVPGASISCTCPNGNPGNQICEQDGQSYATCSCSEITQVCAPGIVEACVCSDGRNGAQECQEDGMGFESCLCEDGEFNCTPGLTIVCACNDGRTGSQTCNSAGYTYSACQCADPPPACPPNITISCACTDGRTGSQQCDEEGSSYETCQCEDPSCVPGQAVLCACTNGNTGAQVCNSFGDAWSTCDCPEVNFICDVGTTQQCFCSDGMIGSQTCISGGTAYGECICTLPPTICDPGYARQCACTNGYLGAQTCQSDGMGFDPCVCVIENDAGVPAPPEETDSGQTEIVDSGTDETIYPQRCEVEETQLCECPSGDFGQQTCFLHDTDGGILHAIDGGSYPIGEPHWGECDCSEIFKNGAPWLDEEFDHVWEVGCDPTDYTCSNTATQYSNLNDVPWELLDKNTLIKVYHRDQNPYQNKIIIDAIGTALEPIVLLGIPNGNGDLPIITGQSATTRTQLPNYVGQGKGVITIGQAGATTDAPAYIVLDNLDIRDGRDALTYVDTAGAVQNYEPYVAAVTIKSGHHITVRNCTLKNSDQGLVAQNGTSHISVAYNNITSNGKSESSQHHNLNMESIGIVYEFNKIGPPRINSNATLIKDASIYPIVRYNFLEGGNRQVDLVENFDAAYAYHPGFGQAFVYGNIFVEDESGISGDSSEIIRWGGEFSNQTIYRKGDLYFYHNTVVYLRNGANTVFNISTTEETLHAHQNVIHSYNGDLTILTGDGLAILDTNFLTENWIPTATGSFGIIELNANIEGNDPILWNVNAEDYRLGPGSPARNIGTPLQWPMEDLSYQYKYHQQREDRFLVGGIDLGALE